MLQLEAVEGGTVISVRANAGARRDAVTGVHDGALRVHVCVAPEKGKANRAIAEVVADFFSLRRSQVELVAGPTSPQKKFRLSGISETTIREKTSTLK